MITRMNQKLHRHFLGGATVELVILLVPIFLLLLVGADFAKVMHALVSLDGAVRVGATTGVQLLNRTDASGSPIYFADSVNGDISFPADESGHDVFFYIRKAAQSDAAPYTVEDAGVTISVWCRCPEYDRSFRSGEANDGETSQLVANCAADEVIRNCTIRPPEIILQVTLDSEVGLLLAGQWFFPDAQSLSRSALMTAR